MIPNRELSFPTYDVYDTLDCNEPVGPEDWQPNRHYAEQGVSRERFHPSAHEEIFRNGHKYRTGNERREVERGTLNRERDYDNE